jgi:serine/threonine protein kinase
MPKAGVLGMAEDGAGRVWLASDHGLLQVEGAGDRVHAITRRDGLPDEDLHCVLAGDDGAVWVSTDRGLARVEGDRVVARYTSDDGLPANEGRLACAKDARGRLWFGTAAGAAIVDPHHLPTNAVPPRVHIEGVTVDGRAVDLAAGPLSLPYGKSTVVFDFTATSLANPRAMKFEYQLEGFDRGFVSLDTPVAVRRATYTNLSPGAYTFVVRATNNDGVWSIAPARLGLHVLTPWWSAWWALGAYGVGVLLLGAGTIRMRTMALRRRADALERKVSVRTEELDQKVVQLAQKNEELSRLNGELVASQQRADRIFSALAEALPGTVLDGKYKLEERIGEGGFGAVFRARHVELRIPVAVKVFRPAPGNDSAEGLERFRREAATACRVNHPNAIKVHDSGISGDGIAYLVMELLVGESLASELARERRVSLARCAAIVPKVCAALQAAHDAGIIHRDVKPANVFLHVGEGGEEVVKVVDFGIARMMVSDASTQPVDLTRSQAVLGTPAFVAPERLLGKSYDGKSDVYSVGVMTYLMLSGRLPYEAIAGESYFARVLSGAPTPLRWLVDLPQEVEAAVLRAIAPSPSTRPAASAFAEELATAIAHIEDAVRSARLASVRPAPPPSKSIATDATVRSDDDVLAEDVAVGTGNGTSPVDDA